MNRKRVWGRWVLFYNTNQCIIQLASGCVKAAVIQLSWSPQAVSSFTRRFIMDTVWYYFLWVLWTLSLLACLAAIFTNIDTVRVLEWIFNVGGALTLVLVVLPSTPKRLKTKKGWLNRARATNVSPFPKPLKFTSQVWRSVYSFGDVETNFSHPTQ